MERPQSQTLDSASSVDTSSAFRSVKEAIAVFGERILVSSPLPSPAVTPTATTKQINRENSWKFTTTPVTTTTTTTMPKIKGEDFKEDIVSYNCDHHHKQQQQPHQNHDGDNSNKGLLETLKKLEAELEETKKELKLLKERESDTEVALATLNAELHKNMSKLAQAEAVAAGKAAAKTVRFDERLNDYREVKVNDDNNKSGEIIKVEEEVATKNNKKKKETLAQILRVGLGERLEDNNNNYYYLGKNNNNGKIRERNMRNNKKMKPIIPLVGDLFSRKKGSSPSSHHNPLYSSPFFYN